MGGCITLFLYTVWLKLISCISDACNYEVILCCMSIRRIVAQCVIIRMYMLVAGIHRWSSLVSVSLIAGGEGYPAAC